MLNPYYLINYDVLKIHIRICKTK